ncbi:MAG: copper chaperone PCu(A)C [Gammaproteobacteria bacterium]|jgi:copper(I)-binding protein|nr:copper chaperone PCu(A)C [Gammaproteobacteria bacterium]
MMRYVPVLLLAMTVLGGCAKPAQPPYAEDPWVREPPPGMNMLAGYLVLHNPSATDLTLSDASSPDFSAVEFHISVMENDVMRMRQEANLTIPAGGSLTFSPGARHLMLIAPRRALASGDQVSIHLQFADGSQLQLTAPVRASDEHSHH